MRPLSTESEVYYSPETRERIAANLHGVVPTADVDIIEVAPVIRGGPGSGHFGHEGRPGEVGGSLPGDFHSAVGALPSGIDEEAMKVAMNNIPVGPKDAAWLEDWFADATYVVDPTQNESLVGPSGIAYGVAGMGGHDAAGSEALTKLGQAKLEAGEVPPITTTVFDGSELAIELFDETVGPEQDGWDRDENGTLAFQFITHMAGEAFPIRLTVEKQEDGKYAIITRSNRGSVRFDMLSSRIGSAQEIAGSDRFAHFESEEKAKQYMEALAFGKASTFTIDVIGSGEGTRSYMFARVPPEALEAVGLDPSKNIVPEYNWTDSHVPPILASTEEDAAEQLVKYVEGRTSQSADRSFAMSGTGNITGEDAILAMGFLRISRTGGERGPDVGISWNAAAGLTDAQRRVAVKVAKDTVERDGRMAFERSGAYEPTRQRFGNRVQGLFLHLPDNHFTSTLQGKSLALRSHDGIPAWAQRVLIQRGGPGSGHHGHAGRPGEVGGSQPGDFHSAPIDNSRFRRGSGVYPCKSCGKMTRATGFSEENVDLCAYCYEESGLENALQDGDITEAEFDKQIDQLRTLHHRDEQGKPLPEPVKEKRPRKPRPKLPTLEPQKVGDYYFGNAADGGGGIYATEHGDITEGTRRIGFMPGWPQSYPAKARIRPSAKGGFNLTLEQGYNKWGGGYYESLPEAAEAGASWLAATRNGKAPSDAADELVKRGGPGSGHRGHEGREGERGGSSPGDRLPKDRGEQMKQAKQDFQSEPPKKREPVGAVASHIGPGYRVNLTAEAFSKYRPAVSAALEWAAREFKQMFGGQVEGVTIHDDPVAFVEANIPEMYAETMAKLGEKDKREVEAGLREDFGRSLASYNSETKQVLVNVGKHIQPDGALDTEGVMASATHEFVHWATFGSGRDEIWKEVKVPRAFKDIFRGSYGESLIKQEYVARVVSSEMRGSDMLTMPGDTEALAMTEQDHKNARVLMDKISNAFVAPNLEMPTTLRASPEQLVDVTVPDGLGNFWGRAVPESELDSLPAGSTVNAIYAMLKGEEAFEEGRTIRPDILSLNWLDETDPARHPVRAQITKKPRLDDVTMAVRSQDNVLERVLDTIGGALRELMGMKHG
jgi:hypothetical protein